MFQSPRGSVGLPRTIVAATTLLAGSLVFVVACETPHLPAIGEDASVFVLRLDANFSDAAAVNRPPNDAEPVDAEPADTGVPPDSGAHPDSAMADAAPTDSGVAVDSGAVADSGLVADAGVVLVVDQDGDGISDEDEGLGAVDTDGDGTPDSEDQDSDNDGILDVIERGDANLATPPVDTDLDGDPDFVDLDSDNDTISDADEGSGNADGDPFPNRLDIDSDNDSVLDIDEGGDGLLATQPRDTDQDGVADFLDLDADGDAILDVQERGRDTDSDGVPDLLDLDSDGDGWLDAVEAGDANASTPPVDTDLDTIPDARDVDSDADGLLDAIELGCGVGSNSSNPRLADSDGDGFVDPAEIGYGSDPCLSTSGIDDFYFVLPPGGPPALAPLLFSNTAIDRADLAINIDTTGSMQGEIDNLRNSLSNVIIPGVNAVIPDAAFAVSSFEDYPIDPFGSGADGDLPFRLGTRITRDPAAAQAAVNALRTRSGIDLPESGLESLFQIASGVGTSWGTGNVPPFNPAANVVPGVADGLIGGVGFRANALPIIVHVTDANSHTRSDYTAVNPMVGSVTTLQSRLALSSVGARVVTISDGRRPVNDALCSGSLATFFAAISPQASDVDWFLLGGANAGDTVTVETLAARFDSSLDSMVAIANSTAILTSNDDLAAQTFDSRATVTLSGPGPFFVAVTSYGDTAFVGLGGATSGHYLFNVRMNGQAMMPTPTQCRLEDGNTRATATTLVVSSSASAPPSLSQCVAECGAILGTMHPLFADFTYAYELSEETNAVVPPCAWSAFGGGRPVGCAQGQCCTGPGGAGVAPNALSQCPLSFEIDGTGSGLSSAMVSGVEALVKSATFDVSTRVRPDPAELQASGLDTTCFVRRVVPLSATTPNTCAPAPLASDLAPPTPELDSWRNVVPGTVLTFEVDAINQSVTTGLPCSAASATPQLFRAFIDVLADGVTVIDTRDVIIIVPPLPPSGGD